MHENLEFTLDEFDKQVHRNSKLSSIEAQGFFKITLEFPGFALMFQKSSLDSYLVTLFM